MRVGGRLQLLTSIISEKAKSSKELYHLQHQIILSNNSHLTTKIVLNEHIKSGCMASNVVNNNLKREYWIVHGKSSINSILKKHKCLICAIRKPKQATQIVSPFPSSRIHQSDVFSFVGMDIFGPFIVRDLDHQRVKRYGIIFSCFSTRLTHVECLLDKSTDEVFNAIERVIAIRGTMHTIFCDNAKEFISVDKQTDNLCTDVSFNQLQRKFTPHGIQFIFNVEHASFSAGISERAIGIFKRILKAKLGRQLLSTWELIQIFSTCTMITNSRPLATATEDTGYTVITPQHLFSGRQAQPVIQADSAAAAEAPRLQTHKDLLRRRRHRQLLMAHIWKSWFKNYVLALQNYPKKAYANSIPKCLSK